MTEEERDRVVTEALEWQNTPYHPHGRLKHIGVDCAMLITEVYERTGLIPPTDPGFYSQQFGQHRDEELFQQWVEKYGRLVETPERGDTVLMRYGRTWSHGGILTSDHTFVHATIRNALVVQDELYGSDFAKRELIFYTIGA